MNDRIFRPSIAAAAFVLTLGIACGDDDEPVEQNQNAAQHQNQNQNQGENDEVQECTATTWECAEFVDGPDLTERRHGHESVVLDDGRVLLVAGAARVEDSPASGSTNTFEVFEPDTDEIVVHDDLPETRQSPTLLKRDDGSVVAVGGRDGSQQIASVSHFDPDDLEWSELPTMSAGFRNAVQLSDERIVALGSVNPDGSPSRIVGQVFDPVGYSWSSVESLDLEHDGIWDLIAEVTPDDEILLVYSHAVPPPDGAPPSHFFFSVTALLYDFETGDAETIVNFQTLGTSMDPTVVGIHAGVTWLPESEKFLLQLNPRDHEGNEIETVARLYDPATGDLEQLFERDPPPGQVRQVLPGDELLYTGRAQVQLYDVPNATWRSFTALPEGIYYSSVELLPDCRLFMSGERTLELADAELRGVDTGYCVPAE